MITMQTATTCVLASPTPGSREHVSDCTEVSNCCPECGQPGALIVLGVRYDRPYRWRPWILKHTRLALCERCDALVAIYTILF